MALPKLTIPTYTLTIPSSKQKVKFRPFLSKEEKVMMLVKQSENPDEILEAVKNIVDVCTFQKLEIPSLALFDIEYIFLQIRAKSVGEVIEIDMKCNNLVDKLTTDNGVDFENGKKECGGIIPFSLNINDIKVEFPADHTKIIKLEKDIGITLRYPSVIDIEMLETHRDDDVEIIKNLIQNIFDKDTVHEITDIKEEDLDEFMATINTKQLEKIRKEFFYTMPSVKHVVKYKCPSCGYEGTYTFNGINDFF